MKNGDFYQKISDALKDGYGFSPLIGSGVSYQSGIMLGSEISSYLSYTYYIHFLKCPRSRGLREEGWPKPPKKAEVNEAIQSIKQYYIEVCRKYGNASFSHDGQLDSGFDKGTSLHPIHLAELLTKLLPMPRLPEVLQKDSSLWSVEHDEAMSNLLRIFAAVDPTTAESGLSNYPIVDQEQIKEKGLRALNYWINILNFFARISVEKESQQFILQGWEDPEVIDQFNTMMVGNRVPNQCHYLLARLSDPLRISAYLTTNFDTLLEAAIRECGHPVRALSLEKGSSIPSLGHLRDSLIVLKLHGELHNTRADESIHEPPSLVDRSRFKDIFFPTSRSIANSESHLLVVGSSLSDRRISEMIRYTLASKSHFNVYIVADKESSEKKYRETLGDEFKERLHFSPHQKPEFVLYELYQRLTLSLPAGGTHFQYDQFTPPANSMRDTSRTELEAQKTMQGHIEYICSLFRDHVYRNYEDPRCRDFERHGGRISENTISIVGKCAVTGFASRLFFRLQELYFKCCWFELEDYCDERELLSDIMKSILYELGKIGQETVRTNVLDVYSAKSRESTSAGSDQSRLLSDEEAKSFSERLESYLEPLNITPRDWVLFIYGRNRAGECSGFIDKEWNSFAKVYRLLNIFSKIGFRIVYLPYTQSRSRQFQDNVARYTNGKHTPENNCIESGYEKVLHGQARSIVDESNIITFSKTSEAEQISIAIMAYLGEIGGDLNAKKFLQFLFKCCLFRQSRHLNALISEAVYPCPFKFNINGKDNDTERWSQVNLWRQKLINMGVFFQKPGGYSWLFSDIRYGLINCLSEDSRVSGARIRSHTHLQIGDWYLRAFFATQHSTPFKEAVYHWLSAIRYVSTSFNGGKTDINDAKPLNGFRYSIVIRALISIGKILKVSREYIPCWLNESTSPGSFDFREKLELIGMKLDSSGELNEYIEAISDGKTATVENSEALIVEKVMRQAMQQIIYQGSAYEAMLRNASGDSVFGFDHTPHQGMERIDLLGNEYLGQLKQLRVGSFCKIQSMKDLLEQIKGIALNIAKGEPKQKVDNVEIENSPSDRGIDLEVHFSELIHLTTIPQSDGEFNSKSLESCRKQLRITLVQLIYLRPAECVVWVSALTNAASAVACWANLVSRAYSTQLGVDSGKQLHLEERISWVVVSFLCNISLDLTRYIPATHIHEEVNIASHTHRLYGLALGRLCRFNESYRRLNEGDSLNLFFDGVTKEMNIMAINQFRVDVLIKQIKAIFREQRNPAAEQVDSAEHGPMLSPNEQRLISQLFDKASLLLSSATTTLTGRRSTAYWRDRLHLLKLRLICTYLNQEKLLDRYKPKSLSRLTSIEYEIYREFNEGLLEVRNGDIYRIIVYYEMLFFAIGKLIARSKSDTDSQRCIDYFRQKSRFQRFKTFLDAYLDHTGQEIGSEKTKLYDYNDHVRALDTSARKLAMQIADRTGGTSIFS